MKDRFFKKLTVLLMGSVLVVGLTGCSFDFFSQAEGEEPVTPGTTEPATPLNPDDAVSSNPVPDSNGIAVLEEHQVIPLPDFVLSEPNGSWKIFKGHPVGFPAGILFPYDSWVDSGDSIYPVSDSLSLHTSLYMFAGDKKTFDNLLRSFETEGWDVEYAPGQEDALSVSATVKNSKFEIVLTLTLTADVDQLIYYVIGVE